MLSYNCMQKTTEMGDYLGTVGSVNHLFTKLCLFWGTTVDMCILSVHQI